MDQSQLIEVNEDVENNTFDLFMAMPRWEIEVNEDVDNNTQDLFTGMPRREIEVNEDVENNTFDLFMGMPRWEIEVNDGCVDGASYGGDVSPTICDDVGHKLAIRENAVDSLKFQLFEVGDELPPCYRLATRHEVESDQEALFQAMPEWEIANLADGSVDGALYGGHTSTTIRDDVAHKLAIREKALGSLEFQLFEVGDDLPPCYRLATRHEVESDQEALFEAMPEWEIAKLADGSVDGALYGGRTSTTIRDDVAHKLAIRANALGSLEFQLFEVGDELPPCYRLATRQEVESDQEALFEAMPGWEIANLADGSVDGALYGGHTSTTIRDDVAHKLAIRANALGSLEFQLFEVGDELPPCYRLATRHEVESDQEALFEAMPEWEIAKLADGSVDGALYGGHTSTTIRDDVGHKLAVRGMSLSGAFSAVRDAPVLV